MKRAFSLVAAGLLFAVSLPLQAQSPAPQPAVPVPPAAKGTLPSSKWESEIAAFEKKDRDTPPAKGAVLFIGSSSIRLWTDVAKDFPQHRVLNRGFGGSFVSDSVDFVDRIVLPYEPRLIFLYAGGNDINAGKTPQTVADDFRTFVSKIRAKLPEITIAFISIAPNPSRWAQVEKVKEANNLIKAFCQEGPHLQYVDVFTEMLGPDGQPKEGIYRADKLHMNLEGYKIWTKVLQPFLPAPDLTGSQP